MEITYGLERIIMALQGVKHFKDIRCVGGGWCVCGGGGGGCGCDVRWQQLRSGSNHLKVLGFGGCRAKAIRRCGGEEGRCNQSAQVKPG